MQPTEPAIAAPFSLYRRANYAVSHRAGQLATTTGAALALATLLMLTGCGRGGQPPAAHPATGAPQATTPFFNAEEDDPPPSPHAVAHQAAVEQKLPAQRARLARLSQHRPAPRSTEPARAAEPRTAATIATAVAAYAAAPNPAARAQVLDSVSGLDDARLLPLVESGLEDPETAVRRAAIGVLASLSAPPAARLIAKALRDQATDVRREAVYMIDSPAVAAEEKQTLVTTAVADPEGPVRFAALDAAEALPPAARLHVFEQALASQYPDVRTEALVLLQGENTPEARAVVDRTLTATADVDFRREVEETLELMKGALNAPPPAPLP